MNLQNLQNNIEILTGIINQKKADGILINSTQNRFWLLGLDSSDGYIYIDQNQEVTLLIDGRYFDFAFKKFSNQIDVKLLDANYGLRDLLNEKDAKKILIEDQYASILLLKQLQSWAIDVDLFKCTFIRIVKHPNELENLKKASSLASIVQDFVKLNAKPGMTEKEVANMITIKFLELGAAKNAFDPIVASGENGANPHHKPTDRIIQANEMITIDIGCVWNGYSSDCTRTFSVQNLKLPTPLQNIHDAVYQSQQAGLDTVRSTIISSEIDLACRSVLKKLKLDQYFVHSTGHGLGIDVHELPNVSVKANFTLFKNMVLTVEPGVYIPGVGGARIEDSVIVLDDGHFNMNHESSKKANW